MHRWNLFTQTTVPSIASQTSSSFRWLVYFDKRSPAWLLEAAQVDRRYEIVEVDGVWSPSVVSRTVEQRRRASVVMTTRFDNDDAVGHHFIELLQRSISSRAGDHFLNFTYGYQLAAGRLYWRADTSNSFITRTESTPRLGTVFVDQHQRLSHHGVIHQIRTRPMWLQLVHSSNLANHVGGIRVRGSHFDEEFERSLSPLHLSAAEASLLSAATAARMLARAIAKPSRLRLLIPPGRR